MKNYNYREFDNEIILNLPKSEQKMDRFLEQLADGEVYSPELEDFSPSPDTYKRFNLKQCFETLEDLERKRQSEKKRAERLERSRAKKRYNLRKELYTQKLDFGEKEGYHDTCMSPRDKSNKLERMNQNRRERMKSYDKERKKNEKKRKVLDKERRESIEKLRIHEERFFDKIRSTKNEKMLRELDRYRVGKIKGYKNGRNSRPRMMMDKSTERVYLDEIDKKNRSRSRNRRTSNYGKKQNSKNKSIDNSVILDQFNGLFGDDADLDDSEELEELSYKEDGMEYPEMGGREFSRSRILPKDLSMSRSRSRNLDRSLNRSRGMNKSRSMSRIDRSGAKNRRWEVKISGEEEGMDLDEMSAQNAKEWDDLAAKLDQKRKKRNLTTGKKKNMKKSKSQMVINRGRTTTKKRLRGTQETKETHEEDLFNFQRELDRLKIKKDNKKNWGLEAMQLELENKLPSFNPYEEDSDSTYRQRGMIRSKSALTVKKKKFIGVPNNAERRIKERRKKMQEREALRKLEEESRSRQREYHSRGKSPQFAKNERSTLPDPGEQTIPPEDAIYKHQHFKNSVSKKELVPVKTNLDMLHTDELMGYYKEVMLKSRRDFVRHHRQQNLLKRLEYS